MLCDSAELESTSLLFLCVLLSAEHGQRRAPLLMLLWVITESTFQPDNLCDTFWFPVQSKPCGVAMTASCRPRPSLPGTIPSCGAAKRTPRTAGGSHLGKPATGTGGKDCRVSVSIRHRINSNLSRLSPMSHTWSKALRGVWQFSWDVTPWQPCSTGCDGHKHKQHWDDSALMLLEKVLSLPSYTDPASVSAPQLCAAHTSCSFPFSQSPPLLCELPKWSRAAWRLWGVQGRSGGGRWFLWVSGSVYQQRREGKEKLCPWLHLLLQLPLVSGQGPVDFPWQGNLISWWVGSWWQEGERPLQPHSSLKGTDPFSKRFFLQCDTQTCCVGVVSIASVSASEIPRDTNTFPKGLKQKEERTEQSNLEESNICGGFRSLLDLILVSNLY